MEWNSFPSIKLDQLLFTSPPHSLLLSNFQAGGDGPFMTEGSPGPDNLEDPVLNLPQPLLCLDNIKRILSPNQKLRTTWFLSPPRLSILCQRIRRERSSIGSVLDVYTHIGDHVRSVHGADMCKESVEMSDLDTRKISDPIF